MAHIAGSSADRSDLRRHTLAAARICVDGCPHGGIEVLGSDRVEHAGVVELLLHACAETGDDERDLVAAQVFRHVQQGVQPPLPPSLVAEFNATTEGIEASSARSADSSGSLTW
jgi:hypothetical protein